jgi:hypothetical protein
MIKKYFLFITLIATCQLFSREVFNSIEKNFTLYTCKTSFGKSNAGLFHFSNNSYYLNFMGSSNYLGCVSYFSCCTNSSKNLDNLIWSGFIGSTSYLRKGRTA